MVIPMSRRVLMNKADIYKAFDGKISKTAIQFIDGEWRQRMEAEGQAA